MTKYIFVTGGVVSSLGKGIVAASLGKLLTARSYTVKNQKFDPYINVDPGTMSPFQHGEVFVTDDGAETDLDLGHYERFTGTSLCQASNVTSGSVYLSVINKERRGDYLGATVQTIPHITNEIKSRIKQAAASNPDFLICEIGGTVGDIEGLPFVEAIRQFRFDVGVENVIYVHTTLLPYLNTSGELKTKPSQHSVNVMRSYGIQPDILVCRTSIPIPDVEKAKLALFTNVAPQAVIECRDMETIYEVPLALEEQGFAALILKRFGMKERTPDLKAWNEMLKRMKNPEKTLKFGIAGKYTQLSDAYISVVESLKHAAAAINAKAEIELVSSEECIDQESTKRILEGLDGVIVPGGFGVRGIEGKLNVIRYARENNLPFLGLCLGMQCAVIEFARNVAELKGANSSEFDEGAEHKVIALMSEQEDIHNYGGTMRLGAYDCNVLKGSKAHKVYKADVISERHRHRYEVNNKYRELLSQKGLVFSGLSPDGQLVEMIELPQNEWFVAAQFHPEYKSRPEAPHPLFLGFVNAASKLEQQILEKANAN